MIDLSKYQYIHAEEAKWSDQSVFIKRKHLEGKEGLFITTGTKTLEGLYFLTIEEIKLSLVTIEPKLGNDPGYSIPLSRCQRLRPPSSSRKFKEEDTDEKLFSR